MLNTGSILQLQEKVIQARKETMRKFLFFRRYYFNHDIPDGPCQKEIAQLLSDSVFVRNKPIALAAPRGFAKSTIVSLEFVIFCICYKYEDFILIISNTVKGTGYILGNIRRELQTNEKLRRDFPEICGVEKKLPSERWTNNEIITSNDVRVSAFSTGQHLRGLRHGASRPSLIILDDIEPNEAMRNPLSAYKLEDWLTKVVLKLGSNITNVVYIGTIHHHNSLLGKFTDRKQFPGWKSHIYKAIISYAERVDLWEKWSKIFLCFETYNGEFGFEAAAEFYKDNQDEMLKGVELLWPEYKSYYELMVIREQEGPISFDSEFQNEPINSRDCIFDLRDIHYLEDGYRSIDELLLKRGNHLLFYGACDPSMGKDREAGDFSAIVNLAIDAETGTAYVLDVDVSRRTISKTIDTILEYYKIRYFQVFGLESNGFQELAVNEARDRADRMNLSINFSEIKNTSNKQLRIESLQAKFKSGKIQISKKHRALLEEMKFYPQGAHDDALDALEMAMRLAIENTSFGPLVS